MPLSDEDRYMLATMGVYDQDRQDAVAEDLALVARLEKRMTEMTFPDPIADVQNSAASLQLLFQAAKTTMVQWGELLQRHLDLAVQRLAEHLAPAVAS